jgi:sugar phosphate isomerase/epimerase
MFVTLNALDLDLDAGFADTVELAAEAGFDAVDLPIEELGRSPEYADGVRVRDLLAAAGLRAGGWWLPMEWREDVDTFAAGLSALTRQSALARAAGARWCNTWVWPFSDELDYASNLSLHAERLRPVAATLAEHDCLLGLEFVGPKTMRVGHRYEFVSTIAGMLELVELIDAANVGLLLDCWQWYTSHGTPRDLASLTPGQVTYVHLNDAPLGREPDDQIDDQRMLPGATGVIDTNAFLEALAMLRFDGPVSVEPFNVEVSAMEPRARVRAARGSVASALHAAGLA